jgi:hypothetical protein
MHASVNGFVEYPSVGAKRYAYGPSTRQPWLTKDFSNPHFERIGASQLIEEILLNYVIIL